MNVAGGRPASRLLCYGSKKGERPAGEFRMLRTIVFVGCLVAGSAQAAVCTPKIVQQWEAAKKEDGRGAQVIEREAKKGAKANKAAICKVAQSVPNLLKAAQAYYEACDPEVREAAVAEIQQHADNAAEFFEANRRATRLHPPNRHRRGRRAPYLTSARTGRSAERRPGGAA
jgi:hypothetical protein